MTSFFFVSRQGSWILSLIILDMREPTSHGNRNKCLVEECSDAYCGEHGRGGGSSLDLPESLPVEQRGSRIYPVIDKKLLSTGCKLGGW